MTYSVTAFDAVVEAASIVHELPKRAILGKRRYSQYVDARHMAIAALTELRPELSMPNLGAHFDMDHTSILHARRRHARKMRDCQTYNDSYHALTFKARSCYSRLGRPIVFKSVRAKK